MEWVIVTAVGLVAIAAGIVQSQLRLIQTLRRERDEVRQWAVDNYLAALHREHNESNAKDIERIVAHATAGHVTEVVMLGMMLQHGLERQQAYRVSLVTDLVTVKYNS